MNKIIDSGLLLVWAPIMFVAFASSQLFVSCIPEFSKFGPCPEPHYWGWLTFTTVGAATVLSLGNTNPRFASNVHGQFFVVLGALWMAVAMGQVFDFPALYHHKVDFEWPYSFLLLSVMPFVRNRVMFWNGMFVVLLFIIHDVHHWTRRYQALQPVF